jgi:hypothetical protein
MRETIADDPIVTGVQIIGWIASDESRVLRFLALTGLAPNDLRARLTDASLLDAAYGFLEGHQPDLITCAEAIGITPERLVAARGALLA